MSKALKLVNGIPRMRDLSDVDSIYDDTYVVPGGGLSAGAIVTLPDNGSYTHKDLEVFLNGQFWEESIDFNYYGTLPGRTQIELIRNVEENDRIRFRVEGDPDLIYDETYVVPAGGLSTGTPITLPNGETFNGDELEVYLQGQFIEEGIDYTLIGGGAPYAQIALTFDLLEGERIRFRKDQT